MKSVKLHFVGEPLSVARLTYVDTLKLAGIDKWNLSILLTHE